MSTPIQALRVAIGFKVEEVALMAGWSVARQREIEGGDELAADEADRLTALLGADVEALDGSVAEAARRPLGALLKSQASRLDARARFALAEATTVAREVQTLRARLGQPTGLGRVAAFASDGDYGHPRDGTPERLAQQASHALGLRAKRVMSVQRDVLEPLNVLVLWVPLPSDIDALAFASEETGPVIVCNPHGVHMATAFGRRVALAHELCHLLFDRDQMALFVEACRIDRGLVGVHRGWFERVERRARAFALYLLAPTQPFVARWDASRGRGDADRVRDVMDHFGIGYEAARSHLANVRRLPMTAAVAGVATLPGMPWEQGDPPPERPAIPDGWLRQGVLARLAAEAMAAGRISSRHADELVRGPLRPPGAWSPAGESRGYVTTSMGGVPHDAR